MTAHQDNRVQQVCNRKETTWWEPRGQIWTKWRESESSVGHAADQVDSDELARGCKHWHPPTPGRRYGKKKSSLWVHVSLSISQLTTNCGLFSRIKWEIYFYKEVFRLFIEFRKSCMREYNNWNHLTMCKQMRNVELNN